MCPLIDLAWWPLSRSPLCLVDGNCVHRCLRVYTRRKINKPQMGALHPQPWGQEANPCPPAPPPQSLAHCRSTRVCTHKQTHTHARTHVLQHTHRSLRAYQFYEWNSTLTLSVITSALVEGKSLCTCLDAHACQPRVLLSSNSNSSSFHS